MFSYRELFGRLSEYRLSIKGGQSVHPKVHTQAGNSPDSDLSLPPPPPLPPACGSQCPCLVCFCFTRFETKER